MTSTKATELIALLDRNIVEKLTDYDYRHMKAVHWLHRTMAGTWTAEEERLFAELSPEEQWEVSGEISARADGHESRGALLEKEKESLAWLARGSALCASQIRRGKEDEAKRHRRPSRRFAKPRIGGSR
jgi:hypothetical protein